MQLVLLIQIVIFLFISPLVMSVLGDGVAYLFGASFAFLFAFLAGLQLGKSRVGSAAPSDVEIAPLMPSWVKLLLVGWTALYIFVVISNDLVFRRQGSDEMAALYSGLPLSNLLVLRGYEVAFFPVAIAMVASLVFDKSRLLRISLLAMFLGFLFMGVADSRAKLLMPILFYYMVFVVSRRRRVRIPEQYIYLGGLLLLFAVLMVGAGRVADFDGVFEYFVRDLVKRTDGMELISLVNQEVSIPAQGTLDLNVFVNFISAIPFLPESEALKAIGLTSSKNFLLREILGLAAFDMNNSVVADLFYFGGYVGTVVGAILYGYLVGKFTAVARMGNIWAGRARAAFLMAFMMNGFRIEVDYFGMIISTARDFLIVYLVFLAVRFVAGRVPRKIVAQLPVANSH